MKSLDYSQARIALMGTAPVLPSAWWLDTLPPQLRANAYYVETRWPDAWARALLGSYQRIESLDCSRCDGTGDLGEGRACPECFDVVAPATEKSALYRCDACGRDYAGLRSSDGSWMPSCPDCHSAEHVVRMS